MIAGANGVGAMDSCLFVSRLGCVTRIVLNRPERLNALDSAMHDGLERAFDAYASDTTQRVCVVTGMGDRAFCAGTDLKAALAKGELSETYPPHGYAGLAQRFDLDKPVIAAVNGLALGGGFELALACDIILADERASFALPEPHIGALALGGGLHRLARQIGSKQAMGMALAGMKVDAGEGLRLGFVNAIAPAGQLPDLVDQWIARLLTGAPLALAATKQAMLRGLDEPSLSAAMQAQSNYPAWQSWAQSDEAREGVTAFVEKRQPDWQKTY